MDKNLNIGELSLRDIISSVFRQKTIIIITFCVIIVATYIGLLLQTPAYEAHVKMHIKGQSQVASETYIGIGTLRVHLTQMEIVKSYPVVRHTINVLKLYERPLDYEKNFCHPIKKFLIEFKAKRNEKELEQLTPEAKKKFLIERAEKLLTDNISTELLPHTDIFTITVTDFSPEEAIAIANVVSRAYTIYDQQQQLAELAIRYGPLHPLVQQLKDNIFDMNKKLSGDQLPDIEAIGAASVKIIEQAISNKEPIGKPKTVIFVIALFVSGFLGIALALVFDNFDHSFKSPHEIIKYLGLPLLGSIPKKKYKNNILLDPENFNLEKSELTYSQFYEDLSDQLYIYMKVNNLKTILLTSTLPKAGISTICSNLGICLGQQLNHKTLIIDANFRNPAIHKIFNLNQGPGLANMLEASKLIEYHSNLETKEKSQDNNPITLYDNINVNTSFKQLIEKLKTDTSEIIHNIDSNLDVIQAGNTPINPMLLLNNSKIDLILKLSKKDYDAVIIDSSNLKDYKDAFLLASHVDGLVIIVNDGEGRRQVIMNYISYLKQKKANPIGVILNKRRLVIPKIIYDRL